MSSHKLPPSAVQDFEDLFGDIEPHVPLAPPAEPAQLERVILGPEPESPPGEKPKRASPKVRAPLLDDPGEAEPRDMEVLDCGHTDWHTPAKNEAARAGGACCEGGRLKVQPSWHDLRGAFIRPLPVQVRRTHEKERMKGFPGYCCDDAGYYIGGIGNDCTHYRPEDTRPCKAHRPPEAEPEVVEPEEVEPEVLAPHTSTVPSKSFKQRQIEARLARKGKS